MLQFIAVFAIWMGLGAGMLAYHEVPHPAARQKTMLGMFLGILLAFWWMLIWPIILARFDK